MTVITKERKNKKIQDAEHKAFIERYNGNLSDKEIMVTLGIAPNDYDRLFSKALRLRDIIFREEPYITAFAKALPQSLIGALKAKPEDVIKAVVDQDGLRLSIIKIKKIKFDRDGKQIIDAEDLTLVDNFRGDNIDE